MNVIQRCEKMESDLDKMGAKMGSFLSKSSISDQIDTVKKMSIEQDLKEHEQRQVDSSVLEEIIRHDVYIDIYHGIKPKEWERIIPFISSEDANKLSVAYARKAYGKMSEIERIIVDNLAEELIQERLEEEGLR